MHSISMVALLATHGAVIKSLKMVDHIRNDLAKSHTEKDKK